MMKRFTLLLLLLIACKLLTAQAKLVESQVFDPQQFTIPFVKYHLPNGLTVILHQDHSDPIVVVDVTYKVGSAHDYPGKSGLAHFFEHLMFSGSKHVPGSAHLSIITEAGGKANGRTFTDRTSFTQTVPSSALEKVLWLESDRMGFFVNTIDSAKFALQKQAVLNERKQNIENVPGGLLEEMCALNFYATGHPYQRPSIGLLQEIESIQLDDALNFYRQHYHPGNAILTIAGNIDPAQALQWVQKYFAAIPARPAALPYNGQKQSLPSTRYASATDKMINECYVVVKFPTIPKFHQDEAPLECLAYIMGQDLSALLGKTSAFIDKVPGFSAYHLGRKYEGEYNLFFAASAATDLQALAPNILNGLDHWNISPELLQQKIDAFKTVAEFRKIYETESLEGRVYNLVTYESLLGTPRFIDRELQRYKNITAKDVMQVYQKYIRQQRPLVFSYVPAAFAAGKPADTYTYTVAAPQPVTVPGYTEAVEELFRSKMPAPSQIGKPVSKGKIWTKPAGETISMTGATNQEIPVVSLTLYMDDLLTDPRSQDKIRLLSYAVRNAASSVALDRYGIYFDVQAERNSLAIQVKCLKKYLNHAADLLKEKWEAASFTDEAVAAAKERFNAECQGTLTNASAVADLALRRLEYADATDWQAQFCSLPGEIGAGSLQAYYEQLKPTARLFFCGDITQQEAAAAFSFLKTSKQLAKASKQHVPVMYNNTKVFGIEGSDQAEIRMGCIIPRQYVYNGDLFKLSLANFVLGGHFNSRLNKYLREQRGITYRIYSYLDIQQDHTMFFITTSVSSERLQEAIKLIRQQVDSFAKNGMSREEFALLKNHFATHNAIEQESDFSKIKLFKFAMDHNLPLDFMEKQYGSLRELSLKELNATIRQYLDAGKFTLVVAGNKQRIEEQLKLVSR